MDGLNEREDRCTHEAEQGRCVAVGSGTDHRCFVHTTDLERQRLLYTVEEGGDLTFTRGLTIEHDVLDLIVTRAPTNEASRPVLRNADFSFATFVDIVDLSQIEFDGVASFESAEFVSAVFFREVEFGDEAYFSKATFDSNAFFAQVAFGGSATFDKTEFLEWTVFRSASFANGLALYGSTFDGRLTIDNCTFSGAAQLGPFRANGQVRFVESVFDGPVVIQFSGREFWCEASSFRASASLSIRRAFVVLRHCSFASPAQLSAPSSPFARSVLDPDSESGSFPEDGLTPAGADESPILASLWLQDARNLTITGFNLSVCRFAVASNLELVRIDGTAGFAWDRRRRRKVLVDELAWRAKRDSDRDWTPVLVLAPYRRWFAPLYLDNTEDDHSAAEVSFKGDADRWSYGLNELLSDSEPVNPAVIARTYRSLRKGFEDAGNAPGAADFYYGEMEMRRRDPNTPLSERTLIWLYWLVSGYGLRGMRAITSLAVAVFAFSLGFYFWGFQEQVPLVQSLLFAANSTTSLFHRIDQGLTLPGQILDMALRLVGPLLFGLFLLSLRNRVKR